MKSNRFGGRLHFYAVRNRNTKAPDKMRDYNKVFAVIGVVLLFAGILVFGYVILPRSAPGPPRGTIWIYTSDLYSGSSDIPNYKIEDVYLTLVVWPNASGRLDLEIAVSVFSQSKFGIGIVQPFSVVRSYPLDNTNEPNPPRTVRIASTGEYLTSIWLDPKFGYSTMGFAVVISNPFANDELGKRVSYLSFFRNGDVSSNQEIATLTSGLDPSPVLNFGSVTLTVNFPTAWYLSLTETLPTPDKAFSAEDYNAAYWQLDLKRPPVNVAETITVTMNVPSESAQRDWLNFFGGIATGTGAGMFTTAIPNVLEQRARRRIPESQR